MDTMPDQMLENTSLGPDLLRTLIDLLPDSIYVKDIHGRYLLDNAAHMRFVGIKSAADVVGKTVYDFYPPEIAQQYDADDRQVLKSGQSLLGREEPNCDPQGKARWANTSKVPLKDADGKVIGLVGISRDITRRKRAEEERDRFFNLTLDLLCITGFDGYFRQVNPAWTSTLGYTHEELLASPYLDFVHPDDRPATIQSWNRILDGQSIARYESRYRCKDGSFKWLAWSASPSPDHQLIYSVARDITERKEFETRILRANAELELNQTALRKTMDDLRQSHEELIQAQLQLIQMEKMDSVGRLAAGVAHEVKNPLAILLMGIEYLTRNHASNSQANPEVLRAMREAVRRADTIVRGLVDFSAARRLELASHDLGPIIEQSLLLVKHELLAGHVRAGSEITPGLPKLRLDVNKIEQVFVNLFINAIHAMPQGGSLNVRAFPSVVEARDVGDGSRTGGKLRVGDPVVIIKVEDTGIGIAPDKLTSVFDPFFTTKPPGKGTGLGMTVSKKIIDLHGGFIDLRNRPEGGVVVTILLKNFETDYEKKDPGH